MRNNLDAIGDATSDRVGTLVVANNARGLPKERDSVVAIVSCLVAVVVFLWIFGSSYNLAVLNSVLLAGLGAMGLDLLMGTAGQVSIGNAAFLALGAFTSAACVQAGIPFPLDFFVAIAIAIVIGVLVGVAALRLAGFYLALATLAAYFIVLFFCQEYQTHVAGTGPLTVSTVFSGSVRAQQFKWSIVLLLCTIGCMILIGRLRSGRLGRAWRMVRDHSVSAPAMGVSVVRYKMYAFVISSIIVTLAGSLAAHYQGSVSYDSYTFPLAVSYVAMIIIGGMDTTAGPLLGAAVVTLLPIISPSLLADITGSNAGGLNGASYGEVLYGLLIVIFVVFAKDGLNGWFTQCFKFFQRPLARMSSAKRKLESPS